MGSGHGPSLYRDGSSVVHRLPAAAKLGAHLTFVLVVVATPAHWFWAFAAYLGLLVAVAMTARIPAVVVLRRMTVEIPFVVFAILLPVVSGGPRVEVLGVPLSEEGLLSGWNILAKGTIGVVASILLAATTDARSLLEGLRVLRLPAQLVDIAAFMVRYIGVVHAESAPDEDRQGVTWVPGAPSGPPARPGPWRRRAVRQDVRTWRAGPPRDAVPGRGIPGRAERCATDHWRGRPGSGTALRGHGCPAHRVGVVVTAPALAVMGLAYAYPDGRQALFGVDLVVEHGERVALLGPNGAGKTTLVLHLNGILTGGLGSVRVAGVPVDPTDRAAVQEIRRRVGIVFQDPDDQLFMPTVRDDVAFGPANLGLRGQQLDACVDAALGAVGVAHLADRPPHHLSLGQRRRVAIATVLAMEPDVLVLDEPTSNLDPAGRRELLDLLRSLGLTLLVVTHDLLFALELCERAAIMCDGRMVADGTTLDLLADEDLLRRTSLELPLAIDPRAVLRHRADRRGGS